MTCHRQFPVRRLNIAALLVLLCIAVPSVWAQDSEDTAINVSPAAKAGYSYSNFRYHILPANTAAGKTAAGHLGTAVSSLQTQAAIAKVPSPASIQVTSTTSVDPLLRTCFRILSISIPAAVVAWRVAGAILNNS